MSVEEIFIASAITSFTIIATLAYLHHKTKEPFWQTVWLFGIFVMFDYSLTIIEYGFRRVAVITDFNDLTSGVLSVSYWLVTLVIFYLGYLLLRHMVEFFFSIFGSKKGYGGTRQSSEEEPHG